MDSKHSQTEFLYTTSGIHNVLWPLYTHDGFCLLLNTAAGFDHDEHDLK